MQQDGGHSALSLFIIIFSAIESSLMQGHCIYSHFIDYHYSNIFISPERLKGLGEWVPIQRESQLQWMESCVNSRCDHLLHSDENNHTAPGLQKFYLCLGKWKNTVQRRNLHGFLVYHWKYGKYRTIVRLKFGFSNWKHLGDQKKPMLYSMTQGEAGKCIRQELCKQCYGDLNINPVFPLLKNNYLMLRHIFFL